jgi:hypothetical protein
MCFLSLVHGQKLPVDFPYFNQFDQLSNDSIYNRTHKKLKEQSTMTISILSPSLRFLSETSFPFKLNTGEMLPGIGPQLLMQAGIFIDAPWFEAQIKPSFLWSSNQTYEWFPESHNPNRWKNFSIWYNYADHPPFLYQRNHRKIYPGQSYLALKYKDHGLRVSNESFFWGPGEYNSLLLSNQSEPFLHVKIHSITPIHVKRGKLTYELFGGFLKNSDTSRPVDFPQFYYSTLVYKKNKNIRYLNGIKLQLNPSILKDLSIGFQSLTQLYLKDAVKNFNYLPGMTYAMNKKEVQNIRQWSYYQSWYFKWTNEASQAELYGEWGRKGPRRGLKEFLIEPRIGTAYMFGFNKLTGLSNRMALYTGIEGIFLARQHLSEIQNPNSWYIDFNLPQGHTHKGQWLGSGIGPGSNRTTLDISLVLENTQKIGILLDRRLNNSDYYYYQFDHVNDYRRYWVDHGIFLQSSLDLGLVVADVQVGKVFSINYQWELEDDPNVFFIPGKDIQSFQAFFNLAYLF